LPWPASPPAGSSGPPHCRPSTSTTRSPSCPTLGRLRPRRARHSHQRNPRAAASPPSTDGAHPERHRLTSPLRTAGRRPWWGLLSGWCRTGSGSCSSTLRRRQDPATPCRHPVHAVTLFLRTCPPNS
jgi:hypothetical protein